MVTPASAWAPYPQYWAPRLRAGGKVPFLRGGGAEEGVSETLAHLEQHPEVHRRRLGLDTTDVRAPNRAARGATSPSAGAYEQVRQGAQGWQEVEFNVRLFRRIGDKKQS